AHQITREKKPPYPHRGVSMLITAVATPPAIAIRWTSGSRGRLINSSAITPQEIRETRETTRCPAGSTSCRYAVLTETSRSFPPRSMVMLILRPGGRKRRRYNDDQ